MGPHVLFNELFPKAEDIKSHEEKTILSISVDINNDETFEINDIDLPELLRLRQKLSGTAKSISPGSGPRNTRGKLVPYYAIRA